MTRATTMTDALARTEATTIEADRRSPAVLRAGMLSMLALVALGGTRLIHASIVGRATDNATYALVATLIGVATTAGLFLPGGLASAASKFVPYCAAPATRPRRTASTGH